MRKIIIPYDACKRIETSKDLSDIYAFFERYDNACYDFECDEERIDDLVEDTFCVSGVYNYENVKRIMGDDLED